MPTSNYRARKLLKKKRAKIYRYEPFTIQLLDRENGDVQPIEVCMDTGYIHIGISVKSEKHEYLSLQVDTLDKEKERHDACRMYRRTRRNRLRYRKARFLNRAVKKEWIAPSLEHKKNVHLTWLNRICEVMPVTDIYMEMGNFDTQVLKALEENKPIPEGADYQHGERYGIATLREAVFSRDDYTCQCCGRTLKDKAIFHVHHIIYRSQGGTNRMANLITVCEKCHTPKNHKPGGKLYNWKPKVRSFKGATFMSTIRWYMYRDVKKQFPNVHVHITYGAETKERRRMLGVIKSHANDAFVMGSKHPKHRSKTVVLIKKRRNNRILEKFYDAKYIDSRDGKTKTGQELFNGRTNRDHTRDTENLHIYRQSKVSKGKRVIRTQRYSIQPHDIVTYQNKHYETSGCHCNGTRLILLPAKKSVAIKNVKLYRHAGGYYVGA